jgi:hypothetical protein
MQSVYWHLANGAEVLRRRHRCITGSAHRSDIHRRQAAPLICVMQPPACASCQLSLLSPPWQSSFRPPPLRDFGWRKPIACALDAPRLGARNPRSISYAERCFSSSNGAGPPATGLQVARQARVHQRRAHCRQIGTPEWLDIDAKTDLRRRSEIVRNGRQANMARPLWLAP